MPAILKAPRSPAACSADASRSASAQKEPKAGGRPRTPKIRVNQDTLAAIRDAKAGNTTRTTIEDF